VGKMREKVLFWSSERWGVDWGLWLSVIKTVLREMKNILTNAFFLLFRVEKFNFFDSC
jgi:predicted 3-demethylubiquinone-9 3-methyltransferase (glyoxalase superfamily)